MERKWKACHWLSSLISDCQQKANDTAWRMPNIKFNYFYRDGANYKNFSSVIFENPDDINLDVLLKIIKPKLIDETWFYVDQWNLPDLHFAKWSNEFDHTWHEFESIEYTIEAPNVTTTLAEFISLIQT